MELSVAAIQEGTVIDHIASGQAIKLLRLLKLGSHNRPITLGLNLLSSRLKTKDMMKIEGFELIPKKASQIAILSPKTTVNIIQNFVVTHKYTVEIPEYVEHFVICPNKNCVTNHEPLKRFFFVEPHRKDIQLNCKYCERVFFQHQIVDYDL